MVKKRRSKLSRLIYFVIFGILLILAFYQQGFHLPKISSLKYFLVYASGVLGIILIMLGLRRQMERNHPDDDDEV